VRADGEQPVRDVLFALAEHIEVEPLVADLEAPAPGAADEQRVVGPGCTELSGERAEPARVQAK
jgi:hypothetical protein